MLYDELARERRSITHDDPQLRDSRAAIDGARKWDAIVVETLTVILSSAFYLVVAVAFLHATG